MSIDGKEILLHRETLSPVDGAPREWSEASKQQHAKLLQTRLQELLNLPETCDRTEQKYRAVKYGADIAEAFAVGATPKYLRNAWGNKEARVLALENHPGTDSDESSDESSQRFQSTHSSRTSEHDKSRPATPPSSSTPPKAEVGNRPNESSKKRKADVDDEVGATHPSKRGKLGQQVEVPARVHLSNLRKQLKASRSLKMPSGRRAMTECPQQKCMTKCDFSSRDQWRYAYLASTQSQDTMYRTRSPPG